LKLIERNDALDEVVRQIRRSDWVAMDTEADSLHHYNEKLCLLQLSVEDEDFILDPLARLDLSSVVEALNEKKLILHGSDFDIRILKRYYPFHPRQIFDTMLGAQVLGYDKQGLADLANRHCGVTLSKKSQKADWSRRPLDQALLDYASKDTHYLKTIHDAMEKELLESGRLEWHRQNCEKLLRTVSIQRESKFEPGTEWQIRGCKELKGRALTTLKYLWRWREEEAKRKDRPSFKVTNSDILIEIAQWAEKSPGQDIIDFPKLPRNLKHEYREVVNRALREAESAPLEQMVPPRRVFPRKKWGPQEEKRLTALKAEREKLAQELKMHPSVIATNAVLETLSVASNEDGRQQVMRETFLPWQIELVGSIFLKTMESAGQTGPVSS